MRQYYVSEYIPKKSTQPQLFNESNRKILGHLVPEKRMGWKSKAIKKVGRIWMVNFEFYSKYCTKKSENFCVKSALKNAQFCI